MASLAFMIAGIYALIKAVEHIPDISRYLARPLPKGFIETYSYLGILLPILPFILLIVMGCILIIYNRKFAFRMFPETEHEPAETRVLGVHALAFSVVGIFLIADSIPHIIVFVSQIFITPQTIPNYVWIQMIIMALAQCLKMIFGIVLFIKSHRLAKYWSKLRHAKIGREMGFCEKCSYDLTGNISGTCPECGEKITETTQSDGQN
ncbi:MAG: hypothetical protein JSV03_15595 [Planctomycetota bacterium]|nr:MAG: hypothetical protein JSV03_15595 [Planctomycetota bacterium]